MRTSIPVITVSLLVILFCQPLIYADDISAPRLIRFQGKLCDKKGLPLDGIYSVSFKMYDSEGAVMPLWVEEQGRINIEKGLLDVELGSVKNLDLPFDKQYWLGVEVEADGEMSPRFKLTSVPYSIVSEK